MPFNIVQHIGMAYMVFLTNIQCSFLCRLIFDANFFYLADYDSYSCSGVGRQADIINICKSVYVIENLNNPSPYSQGQNKHSFN